MRSLIRPALVTLALVCLVILVGCGSDSDLGTFVAGRVVDSQTGAGIAGATVTIGTATGVTDQNGAYVIGNLQPGTLHVTAAAPGYHQPGDVFINVSTGANAVDNIVLAPNSSNPPGG